MKRAPTESSIGLPHEGVQGLPPSMQLTFTESSIGPPYKEVQGLPPSINLFLLLL